MKLHNTVQDQAILSNVGEIGEFRIRNSAKAFNILSSGLYANKIRAIVRELSCNAVDSQVAAGTADRPFDVHLPNSLSPHFSIRDYGTGLSHDQVTSIYTTYFESTKTDSNAFIGALGLGSKSPFSYTDNFTVTAVKGGRKGIYTAFINEAGVPSIALMSETATDEDNGVEVRFAVESQYDFSKFANEARYVYEYFKLRPNVTGNDSFEFKNPAYKDENIIPGVHYTGNGNTSYAIMGNIKYPIDIPNDRQILGELSSLLGCGLVMEFDIGDLDFQASREGLSYIPSTIDAIKHKLETLNSQLAVHIKQEAEVFTNLWDRAEYLENKSKEQLWASAVTLYTANTKFPLVYTGATSYNFLKPFLFTVEELAKRFNISVRGFDRQSYHTTCSDLKTTSIMDDATKTYRLNWKIYPSNVTHFVVNDTNRGAVERAKFHWRGEKLERHSRNAVYVLDRADKTKPMLTDQFFAELLNPPRVSKASELREKPRAGGSGISGQASILKLVTRERNCRSESTVWVNAGSSADYDKSKTYYYVEMNLWTPVGIPFGDTKEFANALHCSKVFTDTVYGVRQGDIKAIRLQKNWVNLSEHVRAKLTELDNKHIMSLVKESIDFNSIFNYTKSVEKLNPNSPYVKLYNTFKDVDGFDSTNRHYLERLIKAYGIQTKDNVDPTALIIKYKDEMTGLKERYPMLKHVSTYSTSARNDVADYINLVDTVKGI